MTDGSSQRLALRMAGETGDTEKPAETDGHTAWESRGAWLEAGRQLGRRVERDRWALGDWAVHGDRAYGDLTAVAVEIGVAAKTLSNLASVARKIETSRRREVLSWSHHAEVASLPPEVGDGLLSCAEAEGWPHAVMREKARAASEVARLEAWTKRLAEEIAQLRRNRHADKAAQKARDAVKQTLVRMKAEGIVVRDAIRRTAALLNDMGRAELVTSIHGNSRRRLAREGADAFRTLSAEVRTARTETACAIGRIAGDGGAPVELVVAALMDDIEEALREIARHLDAAELTRAQAEAMETAFDARMDAIGKVVENDIHPALDRKLAGEC